MKPTGQALGLSVPITTVLDPENWKRNYAWGIRLGGKPADELTLAQRKYERLLAEVPNDVISWHLRAALSELENKLGGTPLRFERVKSLPIDPPGAKLGVDYDRVEQRRPYSHAEAMTWYRIDVDPGVISVERIRAYFYGTLVWDIDTSDSTGRDIVRVEWPQQGIIHILPANLQAFLVTQGGNYGIFQTIQYHTAPIPDFWAVDYTRAATDRGGTPGNLDMELANWVNCVAGITLLSMAGAAQSKGLTSQSLSIDGVSRSIGLQASAIYGLNSALETTLEKAEKRIDWKRLRAERLGLRLRMYGVP